MMNTREIHLMIACLITILFLQYDATVAYESISKNPLLEYKLEVAGIHICSLLSAIAILLRKNEKYSTMVYSCAIVIYNIISDLTIDLTKSTVFFYLVIADTVAIMSVPCLLGFWFGYRHNLSRLRTFTLICALSSLLPWLMENPDTISIFDASFQYYFPSIIALLAYVSYIWRKDVIDVTPLKQLNKHMSRVEANMIMAENSYMARGDVERMLGLTDEGWEHFEEGPVEKSCTAEIIGGTKRKWHVTVRKYRGENILRARMSPFENTKGDYGFSFDITHYHFYQVRMFEMVRIYGNKGMFIELYTKNPDGSGENAVSRQFDKLIKEF